MACYCRRDLYDADGAGIGKLTRGISRKFRKVAWLDAVPEEELRACIFATRT
jgi:hypothetical protein